MTCSRCAAHARWHVAVDGLPDEPTCSVHLPRAYLAKHQAGTTPHMLPIQAQLPYEEVRDDAHPDQPSQAS